MAPGAGFAPSALHHAGLPTASTHFMRGSESFGPGLDAETDLDSEPMLSAREGGVMARGAGLAPSALHHAGLPSASTHFMWSFAGAAAPDPDRSSSLR
jgi:hypothetical protein